MRPFFFGPRQITLEANVSHRHLCHVTGFFSHSCIGVIKQETNADNSDIFDLVEWLWRGFDYGVSVTEKEMEVTGYTGIHPKGDCFIEDEATPMRCGTDGPQMSMSKSPTW